MKYRVNHKTSLVYKAAMFVSASALAVATGVTALAWGPAENRPTYTMESPAPSVTFNSITNSKGWGDERNFLVIKDITDEYKGADNLNTIAKSGGFTDKAILADQHYYMVKAFVHNNAAENLRLVSNDTKIKINIDNSKKPAFDVQATISSSNCGADNKGNAGKPCSVWDDVFIEPEKGNNGKYDDYSLSYIIDTSRYFNNKKNFTTRGFLLSNDIHSRANNTGALLGYEKMDGKLQGCFQYSGYVVSILQATLVRPETPDFDLTKTAKVVEDSNRKDSPDKKDYSNEKDDSNNSDSNTPKVVIAKAGDTVEYEVHYKNTSKSQQDHIMAHDYLPNGMTYEKDSANVITKKHPYGVKLDEKSQAAFFRENGKFANIGSYKSGSEAMIRYRAKLPTEDKLECGENRFENTVMLGVSNVRKIATSIVTVVKKCAKDNPKQLNNTKPGNPNKPQQPQTGICKYNRNLKASDKNCVKPGAPRAGVKVATAAVSLVLFLGLASFITYRLVRANRQAKQSNK